MTRNEKFQMLNPLRYLAAITIAVGGSMHATGFIRSIIDKQAFPWWHWTVFLVAIFGYFISAVFILKNWRTGYYFALIGPAVGGILIFLGFIFPQSRLLILIPGTYKSEITIIGFITLISEPVAATLAAFLIMHKVWNERPTAG